MTTSSAETTEAQSLGIARGMIDFRTIPDDQYDEQADIAASRALLGGLLHESCDSVLPSSKGSFRKNSEHSVSICEHLISTGAKRETMVAVITAIADLLDTVEPGSLEHELLELIRVGDGRMFIPTMYTHPRGTISEHERARDWVCKRIVEAVCNVHTRWCVGGLERSYSKTFHEIPLALRLGFSRPFIH